MHGRCEMQMDVIDVDRETRLEKVTRLNSCSNRIRLKLLYGETYAVHLADDGGRSVFRTIRKWHQSQQNCLIAPNFLDCMLAGEVIGRNSFMFVIYKC